MKKWILFLSSLTVSASPALAETKVSSTSQGGYSVESCENYKEKSLVSFQVGENGIEQPEDVKNGCATKTYTAGVVKVGDKIIVKGKSKDGETRRSTVVVNNNRRESENNGFSLIIRPVDNGAAVELKACDAKIKAPVYVKNQSRNSDPKLADVKRVDGIGCFTAQFKKNEISDNERISIVIYGVENAIVMNVGKLPTMAGGNAGSNPGNNSGSNGTDNVRAEADIRATGRQAANRFANLVVKGMGQIENVRYNLYQGYNEAAKVYRLSERGYEVLPEYSMGIQMGERKARTDQLGINAGRSRALADGNQIAKDEVVAMFDNAMATGKRPVMSIRSRIESDFAGATAALDAPKPVLERFKEVDKDLQQRLRTLTVIEDGIILADKIYVESYRIYDIFSLKDYKFDLLLSEYRDDKAFEGWKQNIFEDRSGSQAYYNSLSTEERRIFIGEFKDQYDDVINKKWNAVVTKPHSEAKALGHELYLETSKKYAQELGQVAGYTRQYKEDSLEAYSQNLYSAYVEAYKRIFNSYTTSAVITDVTLQVVPGTKDGSLTLGDAIVVVLTGAANKGMADGEVSLRVSGSDSVSVTQAEVTIPLHSLSRLTQAHSTSMLYVSDLKQPDSFLTVSVNIRDVGTRSFSVNTSFEALVKRLAATSDQQLRRSLIGALKKFLAKEWETEKSFVGNGFNDNTGKLLVERMVKTYMGLSAADQSQLSSMKAEIKQAYGSRPNWSPYSNDYDSLMEILKKIGF